MADPGWVQGARAICIKDLRVEARTRSAMSALALFAVVTTVAVSFSVGSFALTPDIHAALLWVVLFFSAMAGLARSFVAEADTGTLLALRQSAVPVHIFLGKCAYNVILQWALSVLVICLFQILLPLPVHSWGLLVLILALGGLGLAAASTMVAAIVAQTSSRGTLFTVLAFPLLVPILVAGIAGTRRAFEEGGLASGLTEVQMLVAYAGVIITVSLLVFDFLIKE